MKTINEIFKKRDSRLTKLIGKTEKSKHLDTIFRTSLDPNLVKHCNFANYKNSLLTVTVTNTTWATRLRYAIPDIIKNLKVQPEFKTISNIRYIIATPDKQAPKKKYQPTKIPKNNNSLWQKTLEDLKKKIKK